MQDQAVELSLPQTDKHAEKQQPATQPQAGQDPIARLDRALQRISFAVEKGLQQQTRTGAEKQELVANVDALLARVRDALERADRPSPLTFHNPAEHEQGN
ncbi:hypothetical protein CSR02_00395 [Acetobacter pomorum]|uniref:Uncharacterized protein n=1 Tax=Acetobacter pomorum TaxID=65959 RepID=A0A2G4RI82_9PROT|nr:hypothetical protein [Acetobacter pomorum]KDE20897.1 hypothetical protein AZ09_05590 [Acetobacter aceti 1023]PHY95445.1 hypothetical protein CSR02_00395 [Acetobacter pomorum]GBR54116.1 hypothetical protein AA11825_2605 [Acetobacter pomorum DSM 11825]